MLKFASCVDRTVRQKHKLALLYFNIYLDFQMVVALTSSTVHDTEFEGFQLATWLALYYVLFMKGGYGYSSEYFMGKDLKDINLTRTFKTWWHGAIDKEMTLKDWGSNPSGGSLLPGFLWPFCFVLHFFTTFFYRLAGFNFFILLPHHSFARCCNKRIIYFLCVWLV